MTLAVAGAGRDPSTPDVRPAEEPLPRAQSLVLDVVQAGAVACVLVLMPGRILGYDRYALPKELVLHLTALTAATLSLARARAIAVDTVDVCLAAFVVLGVASAAAVATNSWVALRAIGLTISGVAIFWSARSLASSGAGAALRRGAAAAVVLAAALALAEAYGILPQLSMAGRVPGGTIGNRNYLAHLLALGWPAVALLAAQARGRAEVWLAAGGLAVVTTALVLSRCRSAWVATLAMLLALAIAWARATPAARGVVPRRRLAALAVAGLLGAAAALALPNRLDWRSPSPYADTARNLLEYQSGSGRGRVIQYRNTLGMVLDHPALGVGPGNWPVHYPRYASPGDPSYRPRDLLPTNLVPSGDWAGIAAERGLPALALLVVAGCVLSAGALRRLREDGATARPLDALALIATLVVLAVLGTFDSVLLLPAPTLVAAVTIGALAPRAGGTMDVSPGRVARGVATALVAASLTALALRTVAHVWVSHLYASRAATGRLEAAARVVPGDYLLRLSLARRWMAANRCDRAVPHAAAARELFPLAPAPRQVVARCGPRTP